MRLYLCGVYDNVPCIYTHTPGESYCRRLSSLLLSLCYLFHALINSLVWSLKSQTAWHEMYRMSVIVFPPLLL